MRFVIDQMSYLVYNDIVAIMKAFFRGVLNYCVVRVSKDAPEKEVERAESQTQNSGSFDIGYYEKCVKEALEALSLY